MTLFTENPKEPQKNPLELIHKFSKVAGYKIKLLKSFSFLSIFNKIYEKEKFLIPLIIVSKTLYYLGINLTFRLYMMKLWLKTSLT